MERWSVHTRSPDKTRWVGKPSMWASRQLRVPTQLPFVRLRQKAAKERADILMIFGWLGLKAPCRTTTAQQRPSPSQELPWAAKLRPAFRTPIAQKPNHLLP